MNEWPDRMAAHEEVARLEWLAARWLAAEATPAEERELRDGLRGAEKLPVSLRELQVLLGGLEALSGERMPRTARMPGRIGAAGAPDAERRARAELRPAGDRRPLRRRILRWSAAAAAAAVVAVGLFFCIDWLRTPYCYIDGVAIYDREAAMQATAYFDSFAALDAPNRLVDELLEAGAQ